MTTILLLPKEALSSIFTYLDPIESVSCRAVCKRWSKSAGQGVVLLKLRRPPKERFYLVKHIIGYITFNGRIQTRDTNGKDNQTSIHTESQRTRGHLLKPSVSITQDVHNDNNLADVSITFATDRLKDTERGCLIRECRNINSRSDAFQAGYILSLRSGLSIGSLWNSSRYLCAIEVEGTEPFVSLDLSTKLSKAVYCYRQIAEDIVFDQMIRPKKQTTLRSNLEELDLSGLHHLRELSVRGCSKLIKLKLPQSLKSLDAGGCTELCRINFPNGVDCLKSLDLNGCRELDQPSLLGLHTSKSMKNVIHLDISNVKGLDDVICSALTSTASLETFSCRYAATGDIIKALAESGSAASNLRLVDIAFSQQVTDESVELLARSTTKLERLSMRGCKKITAGCYNHIPIYLERRRHREDQDSSLLEGDETLRSCSRKKGDNLFYFCQGKRKR